MCVLKILGARRSSGDTPRSDSVAGVLPHTTTDALGFQRRRRRTWAWSILSLLALLGALTLGFLVGPTPISPSEVLTVFHHRLFAGSLPADMTTQDTIIWNIRTPRLILAVAVGAGLAVAGAVLQAVVRNMLADPYTLGINSGASTGAAATILFGVGVGASEIALQLSAFIGALLAALLMFTVARTAGKLTAVRLLMAGIAVGYALSAATSFLVFASDTAEGARSVMFWLLGSLALGQWSIILGATVGIVVIVTCGIWFLGSRIDALTIGDDAALTLGINPNRLRGLLVVLSCLLVAAVVALSGSIGFVGLIVPHFARRLVGGRHRDLIPVSALIGATLLVLADIISRTIVAPQEIPIGILTALVGAPFLLVLVRRMRADL